MLSTLGRRLLALSLSTTLAAAGLAGPAAAQSLTELDRRGDVLVGTMEGEAFRPSTAANGDIVRTVMNHGRNAISLRLRFREVQRIGDFRSDGVHVVTDEGVRRDVYVSAGPGMWRGMAEMSRPNGQVVRCAISHRIDYDLDLVTLSFPRTCVSSPRWVRLGVGTVWGQLASNKMYADDAQLDGHIYPNSLRLSPRLRRG